MMASHKKDEEEGHYNPFAGLTKSAVLQEARTFNAMPVKKAQCILSLTKLLYILQQGETLGTREATETFFSMTKLFQCPDPTLRRMVYLAIKAMSSLAEDVIMVTSSLMKDMTGKEDAFRGPAIRALATITDASMLQSIERLIKQAIVDRNPSVQSSALVSSIHLLEVNADVVKRWVNEIQQAASSRSDMAQYHALGLLYHIKQRDRLAIHKLVSTSIRNSSIRSPLAYCLLIRYASKVIDSGDVDGHEAFDFLESCLRHKSEFVIYEAARAIVNIQNVTPNQLAPAVSVLQLFLSSPRPTLRFAAVRTLNKVSMTHPSALKTCNLDMETLITDSNRSVATLAITTLLKTGSESSVDRLMKQISTFMHEITDEFKIVVVDAIRALCNKFPQKYPVMMSFLSNILRDEGGFEYKKAIVDTLVSIIETVPEAKEYGLAQLCEFIEDCEFPVLLVKILFILGEQGPSTPKPNRYIRFIYNRMILECSMVRAAAATALGKFAAQVDSLRSSVTLLLKRALVDGDDEVRDRVTFILDQLQNDLTNVLSQPNLSLSVLERGLYDYVQSDASDTPFNINAVPIDTGVSRAPIESLDVFEAKPAEVKNDSNRQAIEQRLLQVPEFEKLGMLFKSSKPVALTESETEYNVTCTKHVFQEHVVFDFEVLNTLNDQQLENVTVAMVADDELPFGEDEVESISIDKLVYSEPDHAYVCMPLTVEASGVSFEASLDFNVRDCDPETGEADEDTFPDSYTLEEIELQTGDFIMGVPKPNFAASWRQLEDAAELEETFELTNLESIPDAIEQISAVLGMKACERTDRADPDKSSHTLLLSGVLVGGQEALAQAKLIQEAGSGVSLQLIVRSTEEAACEVVIGAIA